MVSKPSEVSLLGSGRKSGTPGSSGEAFHRPHPLLGSLQHLHVMGYTGAFSSALSTVRKPFKHLLGWPALGCSSAAMALALQQSSHLLQASCCTPACPVCARSCRAQAEPQSHAAQGPGAL